MSGPTRPDDKNMQTEATQPHKFGSPTGGTVICKTSRLGCSGQDIKMKMNWVLVGSIAGCQTHPGKTCVEGYLNFFIKFFSVCVY